MVALLQRLEAKAVGAWREQSAAQNLENPLHEVENLRIGVVVHIVEKESHYILDVMQHTHQYVGELLLPETAYASGKIEAHPRKAFEHRWAHLDDR